MNGSGDLLPGSAPRSPWSPLLAAACTLAWTGAVFGARWVGVWPAIGGAALLLGALALASEPRCAFALLSPRPRHVLVGSAAGALMAAATLLVYAPLGRIAPGVVADTAALYDAFRGLALPVAIIALVPVVLGEELVWRGVVQSAVTPRAGPRVAVLLVAVLYALAQAPLGSPTLALVALGCGLVWSTLRSITRSLVPAVVAHLVWDIAVLLWRPLDSIR